MRAFRLPEGMVIHYRKPRALGGGHTERNVSFVRKEKLLAWNTLFGGFSPYSIVRSLNATWIDPEYELVLIKRAKNRRLP